MTTDDTKEKISTEFPLRGLILGLIFAAITLFMTTVQGPGGLRLYDWDTPLWSGALTFSYAMAFIFPIVVVHLLVTRSKFYLSPTDLTVMWILIGTAIPLGWVLMRPSQMAMVFWTGEVNPDMLGVIPEFMRIPKTVLDEIYTAGPVPWASWAPVAFFNWLLVVAWQLCMFFVVVLFQEQWVEKEHLPFPIATPGVKIIEYTKTGGKEKGAGDIFKEKFLWAGFLIAFLLYSLDIVHMFIPSIPSFAYLYNDVATWYGGTDVNGLLRLELPPTLLVLNLLMPTDVLLTAWVWNLVAWTIYPSLLIANGNIPNVLTGGEGAARDALIYFVGPTRWAFKGEMVLMSIAIFTFILNYKYITEKFKQAFSGSVKETFISPRISILGTIVCILIVLCMYFVIGIEAWVAIVSIAFSFFAQIGYSRMRAEYWQVGGTMSTWGSCCSGAQLCWGGQAIQQPWFYHTNTGAWINNLNWTIHPDAMGLQYTALDGFAIAERVGANKKHIAISWIIGALLLPALAIVYRLGMAYGYQQGLNFPFDNTTYGHGSFVWGSGMMPFWSTTEDAVVDISFGLIVTGVMMFMKANFAWFPFNILGIVIGGEQNPWWLLVPLFSAWLVKTLILKFAGVQFYENKTIPFIVGWIAGWVICKILIMFPLAYFVVGIGNMPAA
jgi:hypothetical protein